MFNHAITPIFYNHEVLTLPPPGGGVLLAICGGGVPPASPNPDPISDPKMPFPTPVFRPGLKYPYPFSDLTLNVIKHSICISAKRLLFLSRQLLTPVAGKENKLS